MSKPDHDRLIYEPTDRSSAERQRMLFARLLVALDLVSDYGVLVKRYAGQWGVFVGRHDGGPMPVSGLRIWPDGHAPTGQQPPPPEGMNPL